MSEGSWRVGLTGDFRNEQGRLLFDEKSLGILDAIPNITWEIIPEMFPTVTPEQAERYDSIMILGPGITAETLDTPNLRLRHVARFGVGYEIVDLAACDRAGVVVTITPDGVRRPVAMMALTFMLALAQHLVVKDRLTRTGRWSERTAWMGRGLGGRTLGLVGLGNTGRDLVDLVRPFQMSVLATDPMASAAEALRLGVELTSLDDVLRRSDFVSLHVPLLPQTRGMIGRREIGLMRPDAYLVNTARGAIVDQRALTEALQEQRIAGAGLDVFDVEPIPADDPLLGLDNVVLAPHSLCWTDECWRGCAESALNAIVSVASSRPPPFVVNPAAFEHARLSALRGAT
jgi:phosphoglycerate dehydrogenase-like enzyme